MTNNREKSQIIINTATPHRILWINTTVSDYKRNMDGLYLEGLQHIQIRVNMYRKFFDYHKVL